MNKTDEKLAINGILLVDKPQGLTSNGVLQKVKRLYHAKKAGHTGSLDPLATGMLPICFGEASKFSRYLLDADKCYIATGLLGVKTDTGDALGLITHKAPTFNITEKDLIQTLSLFNGAIKQIPPMFSALKVNGTPLYKYARKGIVLRREAREVTILKLELLGFNGKEFVIKVLCSKGTYIRCLIEDIGEKLGVGAHVTVLHRGYTAGFASETMFSLEELTAKNHEQLLSCLKPVERAVNYMPVIKLTEEQANLLRHGKIINGYFRENCIKGTVRLHKDETQFIGLGELNDVGDLRPIRLLAFA